MNKDSETGVDLRLLSLQKNNNRNKDRMTTPHHPRHSPLRLEIILIVLSTGPISLPSRLRPRNLLRKSLFHISQYRYGIRARLLDRFDGCPFAVRLDFEDAARFEGMGNSVAGEDYVGELF